MPERKSSIPPNASILATSILATSISAARTSADRISAIAQAARGVRDVARAGLPFSLIVMTDQQRLGKIEEVIGALPAGCAVLFRDYFVPERTELAKRLRGLCARQGVAFLVAGDPALARAVGADGLHVPRWLLAHVARWRSFRGIVTASCHDQSEVTRARVAGVDALLISPVFPTTSHPDQPTLGIRGFQALASGANMPVFALGGINEANARRIGGGNIAGIAAISAFIG